ncbi:succinate dehydrogenase [Raineyella fluvialis]|uniref:Succinate dehydrogenase n=1 Tax=Raineyella fluvialis TaxID=2662261 RepID=A0A5Q2FEA4_9ACTN|nr:succinate dehydrogenase [Raineyella fluvialis]
MATATLTTKQRAARSTVVWKAVMAITGLLMVAFLLFHMYGNLKLFAGQETYDTYAHHLRIMFEPILANRGFLWIVRVVMLAGVVMHIVSAIVVSKKSMTAVGSGKRYQTGKNRSGLQRTYASRTMRWGGVIIFLFVVAHLLQFTASGLRTDAVMQASPYARVVFAFEQWWVWLAYVIALTAVLLHLRHGVWSAFTTLGLHIGPAARRNLDALSWIVGGLLWVGFLAPVTWILITQPPVPTMGI